MQHAPQSPQSAAPVRRRTRTVASNSGEGKIVAQSEIKESGTPVSDSDRALSFPVDGLPPDPAWVRVAAGITEPLEVKFSFLRIDVAVELPCGTSDDEVRAAKRRAADLVVEFIDEERRRALGTEGVTQG